LPVGCSSCWKTCRSHMPGLEGRGEGEGEGLNKVGKRVEEL
jgi:hypothetical protein